jgi:uncharacterized phage-associated protein
MIIERYIRGNFTIMTASDLAHIVTNYVNKKGDTVSPKKLQKLLYYVEAWNLVNLPNALLEEDFQAWVHGPVLPSLYHELKEFGYNDLKVVAEECDSEDELINIIIKKNNISDDQLELIDAVLERYGSMNSFQLELLSHSEEPWIEARGGIPPHASCTNIISKMRMKEYYSELAKKDGEAKQ